MPFNLKGDAKRAVLKNDSKAYWFLTNDIARKQFVLLVYPEEGPISHEKLSESKLIVSSNFKVYDETGRQNYCYLDSLPLNLVFHKIYLTYKDLGESYRQHKCIKVCKAYNL